MRLIPKARFLIVGQTTKSIQSSTPDVRQSSPETCPKKGSDLNRIIGDTIRPMQFSSQILAFRTFPG